MKLLFDTHSFLWWTTEPERLPARALQALSDAKTEMVLSSASAWEVRIKTAIGRLNLDTPWRTIVDREVVQNGLQLLPITFSHTDRLVQLELIHRDPFDRILIAQAINEEAMLVTGDSLIGQYPDVTVLWD